MKRMKISELKALTSRPEVVESWDVTAQDPIFLIYLKTLKNGIPVPKHWCQKRRFLQNKRGIIKPPLELPDFIENTGISKIRDNNARKALKQKVRERMQPKLGKMDIDYQVLYDAFFKHQTKPASLTKYENKMKIFKPGRISEKLRVALGIPENSHPPFIINMQRYGPPPAYPNLKIPGVNAPILDPTAEVTPNLWTPPVAEVKAVSVFNFKKKNEIEHWGDVREADEDEYKRGRR
jgi:splicing factor 3B subunit 2